MDKQDITGNGGTSYTLSHAVANANEIEVFVNNVRQEPAVAYTATGTTLTMTGAVASSDDFYVVYQGKAVQTVVPPDGSVTSAKIADDAVTSSKLDTNIAIAGTLSTVGSVGIGTTSPTSKLDANGHIRVTGGTDCDIEFQSGSARRKFIGGDGENLELGTYSSNNTSRDFHMTIASSGTTKIGFNNANSYWQLIPQSGGAYAVMDHASSAGSGYSYYVFRYNGTSIGGISQNGTSGINYNTSSDARLKENVTYDWDATTRLKQLKPARFNFIADADTTVDGFLAHEAQTVVPEAVTGTHNEVDADGNPVMQGIDQAKLVPLLCKTILELEARITALEAN